MALTINKLVCTMIDSIMLFITQIYKAVIAAPSIGMDDAVRVHTATYNGLQRGFSTIRDDCSIHFASQFKDAEHGSFLVCSASPFTSGVGFINFNFTLDGGLFLAEMGDLFSHQGQISIDGISVQTSQRGKGFGF